MARGPAPPPPPPSAAAAEEGEEVFAAVVVVLAAAVAAACSWTRRVSRGCPTTTEATPAPSPARKSLVAGEKIRDGVDDDDASSPISSPPPPFPRPDSRRRAFFRGEIIRRLCALGCGNSRESARGRGKKRREKQERWGMNKEKVMPTRLTSSSERKTSSSPLSTLFLFSFNFLISKSANGEGRGATLYLHAQKVQKRCGGRWVQGQDKQRKKNAKRSVEANAEVTTATTAENFLSFFFFCVMIIEMIWFFFFDFPKECVRV